MRPAWSWEACFTGYGLPDGTEDIDAHHHGTYSSYARGCHCADCRAAAAAVKRRQRARRGAEFRALEASRRAELRRRTGR